VELTELNAEGHAALAARCYDSIFDDGDDKPGVGNNRVQVQQLHAMMAQYHATMAVYLLLADVRDGFVQLGVIR
jgi:hypothetical protein